MKLPDVEAMGKGIGRIPWLPLVFLLASLGVGSAFAQAGPSPEDLLRRQSEQIQDIKARNHPQAEVRSEGIATLDAKRLPVEKPCLSIAEVTLKGFRSDVHVDSLAGENRADPPQGKCIGSQGVQILIDRVQNALIAEGFITTRVLAPDQDLNSGTLVLDIVPGRIGDIQTSQQAEGRPLKTSVYAFAKGDVLNLRDIEQTVENVRRLNGADIKIQIVPAERTGYSDLLVSFVAGRPVWANLDIDDSGSRSTGKLQGNLALHWDNPLQRADALYLNVGGDLGDRSDGPRGTGNHLVHYSIPWGYWSLQGTVSRSRHEQQVAGAFQNYKFHGRSGDARIKVDRVLHRSADARSSLSLEAFARRSENHIDDTEVLVQRRSTGGWELAAQHTQYLPSSTWNVDYRYRRGTGAFGALVAPEEPFGEGTSRMRLSQLQVRYQTSLPWLAVPNAAPGFTSLWRGQWAHTPLTPQDRFCFGGRHTVRGFDGVSSMCGDSGWTIRNEISLALPDAPIRVYAGIDGGRARGLSAAPSSWLLGWVAGARTHWRTQGLGQIHLDMFIGIPLRQPSWFPTSDYTTGFNLQVLY